MIRDRRARSRGVTIKLFCCRLSVIRKVFFFEFTEEGQPQCIVRAPKAKGRKRTPVGHYLVHSLRQEQNGWVGLFITRHTCVRTTEKAELQLLFLLLTGYSDEST